MSTWKGRRKNNKGEEGKEMKRKDKALKRAMAAEGKEWKSTSNPDRNRRKRVNKQKGQG